MNGVWRPCIGALTVVLVQLVRVSPDLEIHTPSVAVARADPAVKLTGASVFGEDMTPVDGWTEIVARVENAGGQATSGTLFVEARAPWALREMATRTSVAFQVAGGRPATLRVPVRSLAFTSVYALSAVLDDGTKVEGAQVQVQGSGSPVLVDVENPPRWTSVLRNWKLHGSWGAGPSGVAPSGVLTVAAPVFDPSGEPTLPSQPSGYGGVTVVVLRSDTLARLGAPERAALDAWVRSGGTLAVSVARPEDLRMGPLADWVGGPLRVAPAPEALMTLPAIERPTSNEDEPAEDEETPPETGPSDNGENDPTPAVPIGVYRTTARPPSMGPPIAAALDGGSAAPDPSPNGPPPKGPSLKGPPSGTLPSPRPFARVGPLGPLARRLVGYQGGSLTSSDWGASTDVGLGELHVLPFDLQDRAALEDSWAHGRLVTLAERAWARRARHAFPFARGDRSGSELREIRRALDPNENFRPSLAIAAFLLLVYAVVAGPVLFTRAARRGTPTAPLKQLPWWSAATFGLIVLLGYAGKGWKGRARRVALVEASSESATGSLRRYRGLFVSSARKLEVRASHPAAVLSEAREGMSGDASGTFRVHRDGATLGDLQALPWQTVLVQEDSALDLGSGFSLRARGEDDADVANGSSHALKNVVVYLPAAGFYYLPRLDAGARTTARAGRFFAAQSKRAMTKVGAYVAHGFDAALFGGLPTTDGDALSAAWRPLSAAAGHAVDWFPDDLPILLGEWEDADGDTSEGALRIESSRVFVRVIGTGRGR
jgi:hypothetical protein